MAKIWTKIVAPLALVGAFAAQTFGVDASRAARVHGWFPRVQQDTVVPADTLGPRDTLERPDTLALRDTLALPDTLAPLDTLPPVADTLASMKDSTALDDEGLLF